MASPKPDTPLENHCTVVYENTLYAYSPDAFQSISLAEDAEWKTLPYNVSVTGAQCVQGEGAMYIVGGTVDSSINYPGLMKYDFAAQGWEWLRPPDTILVNRVNHGAAYLQASSRILIYAGTTVAGDTGPSAGTYTISVAQPYDVSSYPSGGAPNVVSPVLLPWDDRHAIMLGGGAAQTQIFKFSVENGWENSNVQLPTGIVDQTVTKCTLVDGDDGSKVLAQYNLGSSPNLVTSLVLQGAAGEQTTTGQAIGARKRDLTLDSWPSYNSSLAPDTRRTGASISQDSNGRAIISGGDTDDPIAIFDERHNAWTNSTELFFGSQEPLTTSSTSIGSSMSSPSLYVASSTAASAITPGTSGSNQNHTSNTNTVLGATLGAVLGLAAIFIIALLLLRCRKNKRKDAGGEKKVGEKDRLSFADRGVGPFDASPPAHSYVHDQNASQTSLAIISGKFGNGSKVPRTHTRGLPSDASTAGLVAKQAPTGYRESHELSPIGAAPPYYIANTSAASPHAPVADEKPSRSRSSGWSRYFANNETSNLANEPYDRSSGVSHHRLSEMSQSDYGTDPHRLSRPFNTGNPSRILPTLDVSFSSRGFDGSRVNHIVTGSPTIGDSREDLSSRGMGVGTPLRAELARANSISTISSFESSRMSAAGMPQSWTPMQGIAWNDKTASSLYSDIRPHSGTTSPYYPDDASSSYYPRNDPNSSHTNGKTDPLYPPGLHPNAARMPAPLAGRESTVTVFPSGVPPTDEERQKAIDQQDMSWLKF